MFDKDFSNINNFALWAIHRSEHVFGIVDAPLTIAMKVPKVIDILNKIIISSL